ncbi:MAG: hypothetical protein Q9195_004600 [Heterodermia aff. obscurata]
MKTALNDAILCGDSEHASLDDLLPEDKGDKTMPIAVVGLSCRYPGEARDPESLWATCAEERNLWQPIPKEKINQKAFYHPDPSRNGTSNVRGGYFLNEHPGLFDAAFFNLTGAEVSAMDPQQRILLELSYEALENAGIPLDVVIGSDTACFVGSSCRDYTDLLQRDSEKIELFQSTGSAAAMLSNRISYFYDFKGPSVTVDTACSSSLVALHLACNALRLGESGMAVVGGSNLILSHEPMMALSMLRVLSPDGRCYMYDERANGFGRGEGVGCIVLKPLATALKDGDSIRGVIRNSGINQDGRTVGITFPSGEAQVELIERTYKTAGLDPAQTSYVEAHGTGTSAGDPIEASSLSKIFARGRPFDRPLKVGSIKSNIGHLEGGSGIAGVIKTVMMLENNLILPNFDFQKANPRIPMNDWKIEVPTSIQPWPAESIHRASVNSFGFGGSNAHVIIDDARGYLSSHGLTGAYRMSREHSQKVNGIADQNSAEAYRKDRIFVLSAFDSGSAKRHTEKLAVNLSSRQGNDSAQFLDNLAFTLCERRSVLPWKVAFHAPSLPRLVEVMSSGILKFSRESKARTLGFVFTGQGAQWYAMGRELIGRFPVFRTSLLVSDEAVKKLGASWSLLDELLKDAVTSRVDNAYLSQPLCTAVQIALVDLLASWNLKPASVTGHSSGEIAAAYCAGALTQTSALAVSYHRGNAVLKLKDIEGMKDGAMLAVGLSEEEVRPLIVELTQGRVSVACVNSPSSTTVSGDKPAILELLVVLQGKGVFVRQLAVEIAYHSHHMAFVAEEYRTALQDLAVIDGGAIEFYSSVTGARVLNSELGPDYWVSNMVNTVQFSNSLQNLCLGTESRIKRKRGRATAVDVLIEIGPHSALQAPIKQILQSNTRLSPSRIQYMSALVRKTDAVHTCLNLVSRLFESGFPVNLHNVNCPLGSERNEVLVDLLPYTWNHSTSYWAESTESHEYGTKAYPRSDLLGVPVRNANSIEPRWRNVVRPSEIPWVHDHKVQSNIIYPAAGYLAMAIEAAYQQATARSTNIKGYNLREITIGHALVIPQDSDEVETMLSLRPYNESVRVSSDFWDEFCIYSSMDGATWTEHCRGLISVQKHVPETEVDGGRQAREEDERYARLVSDYKAKCTSEIDPKEIYKSLEKLGLSFGPTFANMRKALASSESCVAEIILPNTAAVMPANFEYPFVVHPATLDSCIHAIFPIDNCHNRLDQGTPLPTFIEEVYVAHDIETAPNHVFSVYAKGEKRDLGQVASKDFRGRTNSLVCFDQGRTNFQPAIIVNGLVLTSLTRGDTVEVDQGEEEKLYHQTIWEVDPDFLSPDQIVELSSPFRLPQKVDDQARMVEQVAFYLMERALSAVSADEMPNMKPHHHKLYTALSRLCHAVYEGQSGVFSTALWLSASAEERARICAQVSSMSYGTLLCHIGENLPRLLRQEVDSLSLMMEHDRLEQYYRANQSLSQSYQQAAGYIGLLAHKNPHLNILEIGAGTGGATYPILQTLGGGADDKLPRFANYDFTDISAGFFEKAMEKLQGWGELLKFRKLDIERDPFEQGYEGGSYDLIIAANVLHATSRIENTLKRVRSLLKPGGHLVLIEMTVKTLAASLIFGTLPGWWIGEEESRQEGPLLTEHEWNEVLGATGFTGLDVALWDMADPRSHHISTIISTATTGSDDRFPNITLVTDDHEVSISCVDHMKRLLAGAGVDFNTSTLSECDPRNRLCIVFSELASSVLRNPTPSQYDAIKRIFIEGGGVLWITRGALLDSKEPDSSLVTGLARTMRAEKGDTMLVTFDIDAHRPLSDGAVAEKIFDVLRANFGKQNVELTDIDTEYAERDGMIMIPRIIEDMNMTSIVTSDIGSSGPENLPYYQRGHPLRAEIKTPGLLDSIQFVSDTRISGSLPADCVEIEVKASGINFRDVMSALGQIDAYPLGCECSGIISAVGQSIQGLKVGDHVIAIVKGGCFCNVIRASAEEVELVPQDLPLEIAASLPIVYFTAYYAVFKAARLSKGESILIHAASGALGQALINLCQLIGADIFATVGTLEKKSLLMTQYKIPEDHIFSSRDGTFAKGIMRMTSGKGVDVIMNSLSGDALRLTWNCIAAFGRFVELGKRDFTVNSRLEMRHFEKNVTFIGLDVPLDSHHGEKKKIWGEIMSLYGLGLIKAPQPTTVFGIAEMEKALRIMQSGKHMGKLVLVPRPNEIVRVLPWKNQQEQIFRADASYLLIGGLGGIGRATALWMVKHGARNLIFASPSGLDKEKAKEAVALLQEQGAKVAVYKCDVSNSEDVDRVLERCKCDMPQIRGIIHAAMVSKADLFANLSLDDYNEIMRPKVDGVWNLHNGLSKTDLDFFIMLSSLVGLSGNPSQAAYNAANVFLDAFADYRNGQGLPAVTLDLGRIVEIGFVAENEAAMRGLRDLWSRSIGREEVMAMIKSAVLTPLRQPGPGSSISGLKGWSPAADPVYLTPIFAHFRRAAMERVAKLDREGGGNGAAGNIREALRKATSVEEAAQKACEGIIAKMSSLLMIPLEDISSEKSMSEYGMDSLVAVEMRNWLLRELDSTLPILELLANISLLQLSMKIVRKSKVVNPVVLVENGEAVQ